MQTTYETVEVKDPYGIGRYAREEGYFFHLKENPLSLYIIRDCRDEFLECFDNNTHYVGWSSKNLFLEKMNEFWDIVVEKLGKKAEIIFYKTEFPNLIIIKISDFWSSNFITRSVFSLLLRASGAFYKDSFDKSLTDYILAAECKSAIDWFLEGYTEPTFSEFSIKDEDYYSTGFVAEFRYADAQDLKRKLIKP